MSHRVFTRRRLAIGGLVLAVVVVLAFGAAYGYARSQDDVIANGIHVGSVDLSGLSASTARARLDDRFTILRRPLVLRYPQGRLTLSPQVTVDSAATVDEALALSHRSWFLPRAWRDATGGDVHARLRPRVEYSQAAVQRAVRALQRRLDRPARSATVVPSFKSLAVTRGHRGAKVVARILRLRIHKALTHANLPRELAVPVLHPRPHLTSAALRRKYPSFITIDRGAFTLRLFKHLRYVKSYPIAVGQQGLETPAGLYHIQNKVVNPSWQVPNSAWAGSLAGRLIPPGPDDPLKARWMGLFNGAGIHGTDETSSIGHAFSHGCVRMTIPDVIDLYDRVQVHTPVYIGD
jgi:L,D-transpeptidase catalytic domain